MLLRVTHETTFEYSEPIANSVMEARLRPASHERQIVRSSSLDLSPHARQFPYTDYFGNTVHFFTIPVRHRRLSLISRSVVQTLPARQLAEDGPVPMGPHTGALWEYLQFDGPVCRHPELFDWADRFGEIAELMPRLEALNHHIHEHFEYKPKTTSVDSTVADVLSGGSGVCQDFAHLMIGVCRAMRLPARYVSGYIFTNRASGVRGQDASHAWCQVHLPGWGWLALDPTNDLLVDERYVEVAVGRDYRDVPPTKGIYRGSAAEAMSVAVHTEIDDSAAG